MTTLNLIDMAKIKFKKWKQNLYCEELAHGYRFLDIVFWKTSSEIGKSKGKVKCPCCGAITDIYVWSFSGCGKRCGCCNIRLGIAGAYLDKSEINGCITISDSGKITIV